MDIKVIVTIHQAGLLFRFLSDTTGHKGMISTGHTVKIQIQISIFRLLILTTWRAAPKKWICWGMFEDLLIPHRAPYSPPSASWKQKKLKNTLHKKIIRAG